MWLVKAICLTFPWEERMCGFYSVCYGGRKLTGSWNSGSAVTVVRSPSVVDLHLLVFPHTLWEEWPVYVQAVGRGLSQIPGKIYK